MKRGCHQLTNEQNTDDLAFRKGIIIRRVTNPERITTGCHQLTNEQNADDLAFRKE